MQKKKSVKKEFKQNELKMKTDLLDWYDLNKRLLPWRMAKEAKVDNLSYRIWISEIMLQQTRVDAVIGYYERFLSALPTVEDLANATDETILKLWEGLGYYNRVRNMREAAKTIVEEYNGQFPNEYDELLKLKGIGEYTAGAISSIAFDQAVPAVDGNMLRIFARILGSYDDIMLQSTKKKVRELLVELIDSKRPGDFNQALMDLGATICIPNGAPRCDECPWQLYCEAYKKNLTSELPVKQKKKARKVQQKTILLIQCGNHFLLEKRPESGLLAGMWQFPSVDGKQTKKQIDEIFDDNLISNQKGPDAKHIFSHVEWHMNSRKIKVKKEQCPSMISGETVWVTVDEIIEKIALPSAFDVYRNLIQHGF